MTPKVLVLDGSARQSLAACRALGRAGYDVGAVSSAPSAVAGYSRYTRRYHQLASPFDGADRFVDGVEQLISSFGYSVVVATDDATLACLNARRPSIPTVPTLGEPFALLTDKARLGELAAGAGVDYPRTLLVESTAEIGQALAEVGLPAVVKGERSAIVSAENLGFHSGARVAHDTAAASRAAEDSLARGIRPIVQERVHWTEKTNAVIIRRGGRSELRYVHRVLKEYPRAGGMGVTLETLAPDDPSAARSLEALERICDAAGYEGVVQAELYLADDAAWLIDVNPRFWGSTWFAERLGLRVSERAVRLALGEPPLPDPAVYPAGKRFHHVTGELRWASDEPRSWRPLLDLGRNWRPGDYVEYVDWSDLWTLVRYARDRVGDLRRKHRR